jgi:hypothetical protein
VIQLSLSYLSLLTQYASLLEALLSMESDTSAQKFTARFNVFLCDLDLTPEMERNTLYLLVDYRYENSLAMSFHNEYHLNVSYIWPY